MSRTTASGNSSSRSGHGMKKPKDLPATPGMISLTKGAPKVKLTKSGGNWYTLICTFRKDYDLLVLVVYADGTSEWISTFGTTEEPYGNTYSRYGDVTHTGDNKASRYGEAFELVHIRLTSKIKAIVPVVYSAMKNSLGSFRWYGVSTYVLPGKLRELPANPTGGVIVLAKNASWNPFRFSFVPCVICNTDQGGELDPSQQYYSRMLSERRPDWDHKTSTVRMNRGPINGTKRRRSYY